MTWSDVANITFQQLSTGIDPFAPETSPANMAVVLTGDLLQYAIGAAYVGIGLDLFDSGMSMLQVCQLVLGTPLFLSLAGSSSNEAFVNLVYENVVGAPPSAAERDFYVGLLTGSGGTMTQAELLMLAANTEANALNIDLVGLQQTGVEFV